MNTLSASLPLLRFALLVFLGATTAANGVLMLMWTQAWYDCLASPALPAFNAHFVGDVGATYLALGAGLLWAAWRPAYAFPLVAVALAFSALHAGLHVRDYVTSGLPTRHWLVEVVGIWAPVALLAWLAAGLRPR